MNSVFFVHSDSMNQSLFHFYWWVVLALKDPRWMFQKSPFLSMIGLSCCSDPSLPFNILVYNWSDSWFFLTRTACSPPFSLFCNSSIYSVLLLPHFTRKQWSCSVVSWLFAIPWTIAYQAPLSMEFSRQEYWSGLPFPSPEDHRDPGIKPRSRTLQAHTLSHQGSKTQETQVFITKSLTIEEKESHWGCWVLGYVHCFH